MFSTNHPCAAYLWLTIPQAFSLRYFKISCENSTTENPPRINGSLYFVLGTFKHLLDFRLQLVPKTSLDMYAYAFKNSLQDLNLEKCPPSPFRLSFAWQIWKLVVTRSWMALLLLHRFQNVQCHTSSTMDLQLPGNFWSERYWSFKLSNFLGRDFLFEPVIRFWIGIRKKNGASSFFWEKKIHPGPGDPWWSGFSWMIPTQRQLKMKVQVKVWCHFTQEMQRRNVLKLKKTWRKNGLFHRYTNQILLGWGIGLILFPFL